MAIKSEGSGTNKKWVTLVLHAENLELRKDPGQIPYHAYKVLGFESTLVTYYYSIEKGRSGGAQPPSEDSEKIKKDYPFLETEVPGLKMHFLPLKGRKRFYERAVFEYLKINAKNIDVLNLLHFGSENIFYGFIYKYYNPKGKIYLKLDIDLDFYNKTERIFQIAKLPIIGKWIEWIIIRFFFNLVSIISAESSAGLMYFKNRFKPPTPKLILLPNGVDEDRIKALVPVLRTFEEKENIILSVGRIGNIQKNNEMLMEAVSTLDLKDWKVFFVGPIEKEFLPKVERYYEQYPKLREKVFFVGASTSPQELYEYYNRAKIFCLTSRWEGFPLVCCEAAYFGNYLLYSNKINAFETLTDNGKYGTQFSINDIEALKYLLMQFIESTDSLKIKTSLCQEFAKKNLTWQESIKHLIPYL